MNDLLIKIGFWVRVGVAVVFIFQLLFSMWMVVWSWALLGTLTVLFIIGVLLHVAGEENWFE